jgi:hypothetical protein
MIDETIDRQTMGDSLMQRTFLQQTSIGMVGLSLVGCQRPASVSESNSATPGSIADSSSARLWFDRPASGFNEDLPLGNGRIGAMVHGGVAMEKVSLNEDTLWAGQAAPEPSSKAGGTCGPETPKLENTTAAPPSGVPVLAG